MSVHADFTGSSEAIPWAINVPICYTRAMTCYAVKVLTTPRIPNNEGSVRPIHVTAPAGCILNAVRAVADRRPAHRRPLRRAADLRRAGRGRCRTACRPTPGMLNLINVQGRTRDGRGVSSIFFASGGYGALAGLDGAPTTPSPSNMTGTSIEVWENLTGMHVARKELLADSGGAGEFRGGLGQRIELVNDSGADMVISCLAGRTQFAPAGVLGGASRAACAKSASTAKSCIRRAATCSSPATA